MKYFFRLDFGKFCSRYTNSFEFKTIPPKEKLDIMVQMFLQCEEAKMLKEKYGFSYELEKEK